MPPRGRIVFSRRLFIKLFLLAFLSVCVVLTSMPEVALQTIHLDSSNYSISLRVKVALIHEHRSLLRLSWTQMCRSLMSPQKRFQALRQTCWEMLKLADGLVITWNLFCSPVHKVNIVSRIWCNLIYWSLYGFKVSEKAHLVDTLSLISLKQL